MTKSQATAISCVQLNGRWWEVMLDDIHPAPSRYCVRYGYTVNGTELFGDFESSLPYIEGEKIDILVDTKRPERTTVVEQVGSRQTKIVAAVFGLFLAAGIIYLTVHFELEQS